MKHFATRDSSGTVCCTTDYDDENQWIFANWIGFIKENDIKNWAEPFLQLIIETRCNNFLNSNLEVQSTWQSANNWIATELVPQLIAAGLKNYAHIVPSQLFGKLSAVDLESKIKGTEFTMRIFDNLDSAGEWLKSCENSNC